MVSRQQSSSQQWTVVIQPREHSLTILLLLLCSRFSAVQHRSIKMVHLKFGILVDICQMMMRQRQERALVTIWNFEGSRNHRAIHLL